MRFFLITILSFFCLDKVSSQSESNQSYISEGGKVLIELIKTFKSSPDDTRKKKIDCTTGNLTSLCFENLTPEVLKVKLTYERSRKNETPIILVIPGKARECSFSVRPGIYRYEVLKKDTHEILRKGEVFVNACEENLNIIRQR
ncbi:MAG: hypothetical protein AAF502_21925 [Bacteroidota bacterium]